MINKNDKLILKGIEFSSRLLTGTGKFPSKQIIPSVIDSTGTEMITVALRRVDLNGDDENILNYIDKNKVTLLPNTSGARNAEEAVRIARLARAAGMGDFIKIEVINDQKYLLPDNAETIKATKILATEGFIVLPYVAPDLIDMRRLEEAGAAAIMPLGAPIGTNKGLMTKEMIKILIEEANLPIIVDAGIGKPSHAFYEEALRFLEVESFDKIEMISDDAVGDLVGIKKLGAKTTLVLSGKCKNENEVLHVKDSLDRVVTSIGHLNG